MKLFSHLLSMSVLYAEKIRPRGWWLTSFLFEVYEKGKCGGVSIFLRSVFHCIKTITP